MKKVYAVLTIGLLCFLTISTLMPLAQAWTSPQPFNHHAEMARDALEGLGWSNEDIDGIPEYASEEEYTYYAHRVGEREQDFLLYYCGRCGVCDECTQGMLGGAELGAKSNIAAARAYYKEGNAAEGRRYLGYAIHFIQDSVCPAHVFPFQLSIVQLDFELTAAILYGFRDWPTRVRNAPTTPIGSAEDLRIKTEQAANEVLGLPCSYLRADWEYIGDETYDTSGDGWTMSGDNIGLCMEKAASLVKGAAEYAMGGVQPEVVCVPFHGKYLGVPHDAWTEKEIVLKGTAHDPDGDGTLAAYKWDFGDGYSTDWIAGVNPYAIEARHTYSGTMSDGTTYGPGKFFTAWLSVKDSGGNIGKDSYFIAIRDVSDPKKKLEFETNVAIDNGLWWLHKTQYRYSSGGIDYGYWSDYGYNTGPTSTAVLAFEIHGHAPIGDKSEDPYVETVQRGLNYVFTQCFSRSISGPSSSCPYGNPDTNGNGIGIDVTGSRPVYEIGMVMMAIAASGDKNLVAATGPANVVGRTYFDILTDMVDMCAWGQNEAGSGRGGWRYGWNYGNSDNSVTQWPIIGLEAAETNWGIQAPSFVKSELDGWLAYSQNANGGFGYTSPTEWVNVAKTGAGLCGLAYIGLPSTDARAVKAVNYLNLRWGTSGTDGYWGNYYSLYAVMKGCRLFDSAIEYIGSHNWYYDDPGGFARYLVNQQMFDGKWPIGSYGGYVLDTGWAILTLTPTITFGPPVANAGPDVDNHPPEPVSVKFDASGSYHTDPTKKIVLCEWDFESDGTWDYSGTAIEVEHSYPAYKKDDGSIDWDKTAKDYTVTLRVTDDSDTPKQDTDTCIVHITPPPWKPVADPDGPYDGSVGVSIQLDGSKSYDPESKMYSEDHPWYETIAKYEWDLDNDGLFDDSTEIKPSRTWDSKGTYSVGLKVTDTQPSGPSGTIGPLDVDTKYATVVIKSYAPIGDLTEETISDYIQSADINGDGRPDYAWTSGYDVSFVSQTLHIEINIQLVGDNPGDALRQQWEQGIEGIWSNSYDIVDGPYTYPLEVEVNWVDTGAHHVVTVHSGSGRSNMLHWYTDSPGGWGNEYHDEIAAHEAGHMLALYDEYAGGALDPDTQFTTTNSLMADLGPTRSWHYEEILDWLETRSGRDLSLAQSPLPPYPLDDPIPDFNDPFDIAPPNTEVVVGEPRYVDTLGNIYVTSATSFTLIADDGSEGSGVAAVYYRIYSLTYDSGWSGYSAPFFLTGLEDGTYSIDYYSTDVVDNVEPTNTTDVILDNTGPESIVSNPPAGWALQDGVTFQGLITDVGSGVLSMMFSIRAADDGEGIPIGFENLLISYDPNTGAWSFFFDTLQVPDGYYVLHIEAEDNLGNEASTTIPYSVRNWAVIELLPSSEDNKAGRTMPVKFALRVAAEVDPNQPFVYNEELRIEIYATSDPAEILQESYFGDTSRDYRISSVLYVTNFRTLKTPMEYTVAVYRDTFDVGSFTFETVK